MSDGHAEHKQDAHKTWKPEAALEAFPCLSILAIVDQARGIQVREIKEFNHEGLRLQARGLRIGSPVLHALDVGAEHEEFLVDVLVAAVDVIEAADLGGAGGGKGGKHECGGGTKV
jgi:hypothetical protein